MKTAVEWLIDELNKSTSLTSFVPECNDDYKQEILGIIQQAKAMEKEQICSAYLEGIDDEYKTSEQYYNKTFKSE